MSNLAGSQAVAADGQSSKQPTGKQSGTPSRTEDSAAKLLEQAEAALHGLDGLDTVPKPFRLEDLVGDGGPPEKCSMDLLQDVDLDLRIELGRTRMHLEEVLKLRRGSVVTLDKLAGDPVDVYVNGRLVARGEVLVLNDNFCVRVAELIGSDAIVD